METAVTFDRSEPRPQAPRPAASPSKRYVVTWTTLPGCNVPAPEAQDRARQLAQHLEQVARLRESVHIHLSADPDTCAEHNSGDIGLRHRLDVVDGVPVETADVLVGDGTTLTREIATAVPWNELSGRLARLIRTYQVEGCGRDTFATWVRGLSDHELRERLGIGGRTQGMSGGQKESASRP